MNFRKKKSEWCGVEASAVCARSLHHRKFLTNCLFHCASFRVGHMFCESRLSVLFPTVFPPVLDTAPGTCGCCACDLFSAPGRKRRRSVGRVDVCLVQVSQRWGRTWACIAYLGGVLCVRCVCAPWAPSWPCCGRQPCPASVHLGDKNGCWY